MDKTTEPQDVDLGFAEECHSLLLTNGHFPSKVGGKPAWLELKNLPKREELQCAECSNPCIFLGQIYAPIETDPKCFHRSIFIFICSNEQCFQPNSARNIIAFRSQLRRENNFYSSQPIDEAKKLLPIPALVTLCEVCGCSGPFVCSRCKKAFYCSQSHQKIGWKNGHKAVCKGLPANKMPSSLKEVLLPEFEIVIEQESDDASPEAAETEEQAEQRRINEFESLVKSGTVGDLQDLPESELAQFANENADDDKYFRKFKKIVDRDPEQILRYDRGGSPLWITKIEESKLEEKIEKCQECGGERKFEFQIMPQMLNYLKNDKLDWGVIAVYTCSQSCDINSKYVKEYVIKQDLDNKT